MKSKQWTILAALCAVVATASPSLALTKFGELSEYYIDYADVKQGASITSPCKGHPDAPKLENIIVPMSRSFFVFADGIEQHEEFTIDLGQERMLGETIFEMTDATVYGGEIKRKPNKVVVEISAVSADGPWKQVYKLDPADVVESFALENVPARWMRFDLGTNTDGVGSRVRKVKVYKRYQLASATEIMKEFYKQFRRDAKGLEAFWKAVDVTEWDKACDAIIEHYAAWPGEGKGKASPRVAQWMRNEVEDGGAIYKYDSTDWDWFRQKTECAQPTLGGPPGGATILHLLKTAYAVTGDEAYAKQLAGLLKDWLQDLPCPGVHRGQNGSIVDGWAGIVASQRTWSFGQMVHAMFKDKVHFDRDLKINLLYSLWEHINFMKQICPDLGGNWLTNANTCLFTSAVEYPEFVQYKDWLSGSVGQFETALTRDFFPSGKASEDSTMYTPISANQLSGQYDEIRKAGLTINAEAQRRMAGLWDLMTWVHYPDLSAPAIGDAHRDSPLTKDAGAVPASYLKYFNRPDLVFVSTQGKKGKMPDQASHASPDFGWYVMRSPWNTKPYTDARQLFVKASKNQGHGHRDQLEVMMYAYGREILTDPGQPAYGIPIDVKVRPTSAHNTICVDEQDQGGAKGTERAWAATKGADFADLECAPYKGLVHRRQIVFLKSGKGAPDYWLIRDSMTGEGKHTFDLNFHFSEGAKPTVVDGSVCSTYAKGGNALLRCLDQSVKPEIIDANISLVAKLVPSNICRFRTQQSAPAKFDTLVFPFNGPKSPTISAEYLKPDPECANADAIAVRVANGFGYDIIVISSSPGTALSFDNGKIKTDAGAAVVRLGKNGKVIYAFNDSGVITYDGKPIVAETPVRSGVTAQGS